MTVTIPAIQSVWIPIRKYPETSTSGAKFSKPGDGVVTLDTVINARGTM
jgi:hypothetical protein